jgi:RNA polymerase sigma-70 factor (ECF subfamily)
MDGADEELLAALRGGDEGALDALLARYAPAIHRLGMRMCRDPEDAQDVLQDTLLAAARGLRDFRGASSLTTWLYTVARSFCIKKRRASKFAPAETVSLDDDARPLSLAAAGPGPEDAAVERDLGRRLERAIAALEPTSREVLVLRDVEGLTAPEVAEVLGVSVDAVKSRLHRARADVRARLEGELHRDPSAAECPDVVELFSRYLEGEIGPTECAAMQSHVASCRQCGAACESLRRTLASCHGAPRGDVPPGVQAQVREALRAVMKGA